MPTATTHGATTTIDEYQLPPSGQPIEPLSKSKLILAIVLFVIGEELLKDLLIFDLLEPYLFAEFGERTAERLAEGAEYLLFCLLFIPMAVWFVVRPVNRTNRGLIAAKRQTEAHNQALSAEVERRSAAEAALRRAHDELEERVAQRTRELHRSHQSLADASAKRRAIEAQLQQAHKLEAVGRLAGGIAHDFNNILAAIIGYLELAQLDLATDHPARSNNERALLAAQRARDLVAQILAFSRHDPPTRQPIPIVPLVDEVLDLVASQLPGTVHIQRDYAADSGSVLGDATQIHQVVLNLCTNAGQAMSDEGELRVETRVTGIGEEDAEALEIATGDYLELTVSDTGVGMAPDVQDRVFEPYFTTKRAGAGTGMGLAVVHGIVAAHRGAVRVTSQPGTGTTFSVYLPRADTAAGHRRPISDRAAVCGSERILVVDDDADVRQVLTSGLEMFCYQVTATADPMVAREWACAGAEPFAVVITDQTMPQLTGTDLARAIAASGRPTRVILYSGYHPDRTDPAIDRHLRKPCDLHEVGRAIRDLIDGPSGEDPAVTGDR